MRLTSVVFIFAAVALYPLVAHAQPKLKETYKEYVACPGGGGCNEEHKGTVSISFSDLVDPAQTAPFNADTDFRFEIGDLILYAPLGSDPKYQPGDTKVTLTMLDGTVFSQGSARIKLSWKNGKLGGTIKGKLPGIASPLAQDRLNDSPYPVIVGGSLRFHNGPTDHIATSFGARYDTVKSTRKEETHNGTPYTLETIKIKGPVPIF